MVTKRKSPFTNFRPENCQFQFGARSPFNSLQLGGLRELVTVACALFGGAVTKNSLLDYRPFTRKDIDSAADSLKSFLGRWTPVQGLWGEIANDHHSNIHNFGIAPIFDMLIGDVV